MTPKLFRTGIAVAVPLALAQPAQAQVARPTGTTQPRIAPTDADRADLLTMAARTDDASKVELGPRPDVTIAEIRFIGDGVPGNVAKAAQRFVGRRASAETLNALATAMSNAFRRSSVALFTLVIPEQDLSRGIVDVAVAEGHITSVTLAGDAEGGPAPLVQRMVEPLPGRRPLTRATYERAIGLIEDIPGLTNQLSIGTSGEPGGIALGIELDARRPTVGIGYTSRTTQFINGGVFEGNARTSSILRAGDNTAINVATSTDFDSLRYAAISHDTPIGSDGMRLALTTALLGTRPHGLVVEGKAFSGGMSVSYPVIRSARHNLSVSGGVDYLDARNALFGSTIAAERTWTARGAALWRLSEQRTAIGARIGFAQGLDIAGARVDPSAGEAAFLYADASIEANQAIGKRAVLRLAASSRWTRDALPAAERFTIGGATFGRAFDDALVSGDRGYATLGELALRPIKGGDFASSELYGFVDYGEVAFNPRPAFESARFRLGSWGGGVRAAWSDKAMLGFEVARAHTLPAPGIDDQWRAAISWRLSLRP